MKSACPFVDEPVDRQIVVGRRMPARSADETQCFHGEVVNLKLAS